jgi:hypothetical protein
MKHWLIGIALLKSTFFVFGQSTNEGSFTGNMETTFQYLNSDSLIGASQPESKGLMSSYMNVFYRNGNFKAGMRVESYLPRIQGYPNRFDGTGIGMRFLGYANDFIDVTLGHFYEQFGLGTALRAYEDRNLGYDNVMDGARIIVKPTKGVQIKGVYGFQRYSFQEGRVLNSEGITRGVDAQIHLNDLVKSMRSTFDVTIGGSFVSKYQADNDPEFILPQNVGVYGGRLDMRYKKWTLNAEYTHKENDPSADNGYLYNTGHSAVINMGYSQKGLGVVFSAKSVDNMSFRSDRTKDLQDLLINFLPALNKTHSYNLVATLYPYATRPIGEIAYQGEVLYTIPKGKINKKYSVPINVNYSSAFLPIQSKSGINPLDSSRIDYVGKPFNKSDSLLWRDFNVNLTYKFNKSLYLIVSYFNISLNNDVSKISGDAKGIIQSHIGVAELGWKINKKNNLRMEFQLLTTNKIDKMKEDGTVYQVRNDKGNWATIVAEYTVSPHWFFAVMDQYNYGNNDPSLRLHYLIGTVGYLKDATRIAVNYGRQRAGLFCVGGVCRFVPASNGLTLTVSHSF